MHVRIFRVVNEIPEALLIPLTNSCACAEDEVERGILACHVIVEVFFVIKGSQFPCSFQVIDVLVQTFTNTKNYIADVEDSTVILKVCWYRFVDWEEFANFLVSRFRHQSDVCSSSLSFMQQDFDDLCRRREHGDTMIEHELHWFSAERLILYVDSCESILEQIIHNV